MWSSLSGSFYALNEAGLQVRGLHGTVFISQIKDGVRPAKGAFLLIKRYCDTL
jgi:arylamine N-acetyltransferase